MGRKKLNKVRLTIFVEEEKMLHIYAAVIPEGLSSPPHGSLSEFFNQLLDVWLAAKIRKEQRPNGNA